MLFKGKEVGLEKGDLITINLGQGLISFSRNGTDLHQRVLTRPGKEGDNKMLLGFIPDDGAIYILHCLVEIIAATHGLNAKASRQEKWTNSVIFFELI